MADPRVDVEVLPALSFLDLAWARLGVDPVALGARLVDGRRFEDDGGGGARPAAVGQCDQPHVLSDIKLALDDGPTVVVLQRLGLPDESVRTVAWDDLDRDVEPDHLTSLWIPTLAAPVAGEVARFHELVRTLRAECPWDREQTHASLTRHLLEETYEVLEAIDHVDEDAGTGFEALEEELGDLLFQVVFHSVLAAEEGQFTLADVARGIHDKLHARHPHVFEPGAAATDVAQLTVDWERRKVEEKGRDSVMDGIPAALPALAYAAKVQKKAASQGVDWRTLVDEPRLARRPPPRPRRRGPPVRRRPRDRAQRRHPPPPRRLQRHFLSQLTAVFAAKRLKKWQCGVRESVGSGLCCEVTQESAASKAPKMASVWSRGSWPPTVASWTMTRSWAGSTVMTLPRMPTA